MSSQHTTTPSDGRRPGHRRGGGTISNRFVAQGLCDLIALAREELSRAEAALKELADLEG